MSDQENEVNEFLEKHVDFNFGALFIDGWKLVCTCCQCPEQYDVFDAVGTQVAYFRLRHGKFRADVPDVGGHTVYFTYTRGGGEFFDDDERERELQAAITAVRRYYERNESTPPSEGDLSG